MPKKFLHSLLQAIFMTLVAFMIMDFVLLRKDYDQQYLGGEPHFFAVIGGMMLVCTGVRMLADGKINSIFKLKNEQMEGHLAFGQK